MEIVTGKGATAMKASKSLLESWGYEDGYKGRKLNLRYAKDNDVYSDAWRAGRVDRWHDDHVCSED